MFFSFCVLKPVTENCVRKKQFCLNLLWVCEINITAPKKLDCFLLGFSVTVGEFNSDMQYYFTVMQAVLQ